MPMVAVGKAKRLASRQSDARRQHRWAPVSADQIASKHAQYLQYGDATRGREVARHRLSTDDTGPAHGVVFYCLCPARSMTSYRCCPSDRAALG
jgi:hypothetical protein